MSFYLCGAAVVGWAEGGLVLAAAPRGYPAADVLHALWLMAAFSLVYAATRHEQLAAILDHSWRFGAKVTAVLLAVLGALVWMSRGL
jgi:Na+/alanine symporter